MTSEETNELREMKAHVQKITAELTQRNIALQEEIAERKRIEKEMLEITQKEQRRFGSQLHDGLCQELAGILMFVRSLTQKMEKHNQFDVAELNKISILLDGAVNQARATARGLYPGELEDVSLMHMLEDLVARTQSLSGISCVFHCPGPVLISEHNIATHLYKIAQEAVSNAVKHSQSQLIEVGLAQNDGYVTLSVKDNGTGFIQAPSESMGIGLKIMKYRAHMMDARFQIESNEPHGVSLICTLKELPCTP